MVKKIIKLEEGSIIPNNAKLISSEDIQIWEGDYEYFTKEGIFTSTDYRRKIFKRRRHFYYEVEIEGETK